MKQTILLRNKNAKLPASVGSNYLKKSLASSVFSSTSKQAEVKFTTDEVKNRLDNLNLWHSVETIKRLGHRMAQLDPLELNQPKRLNDLTWAHTLIERIHREQRDAEVPTSGLLECSEDSMKVGNLLDAVYSIYAEQDCGLEFAHLSQESEIHWLTSNWEKLNQADLSETLIKPEQQQQLAKLLLECETFDHFMAAKFPTTKRYGCEGAESMLVVFDEILKLCHLGTGGCDFVDDLSKSIGSIDHVVIGMPHRGRLNLLSCLLGFDASIIFNKTRGELELNSREAWMASGDVLSHLSTNVRFVYGLDRQHIGLSRDTPKPINVSLLPNPSHLEISSPMVMGVARGRASNMSVGYSSSPKFNIERALANELKENFKSILPIQVHGDASVSGQGIIQETLQMSQLENFSVGGSIHLILNNQIGYTTEPKLGRSSMYCSDIFKFIEAPIVHVNGYNIESVLKVTKLALAYRQKFHKDIVIDLTCFRKHGHNELDEPSFTQPIMYDKIKRLKSIPQAYCEKINLNEETKTHIVETFKIKLTNEFKKQVECDNDNYRNFNIPSEFHRDNLFNWKTGYNLAELKQIALDSVKLPDTFQAHPNLKKNLIQDRQVRSSTTDQVNVDWATAEILAFGSLLKQNNPIRLAGQDVARGTFSTRHAILFDQSNNSSYIPLNNMAGANNQAKIEVANTILSEEAALAYEFGYSIETCALTIWEAQFGDFFNTAQSIIDTLISSSESKWLKQSPLTLLLPHGLDGAGPEHSSSHIERFLQSSSSQMDKIDTEAKVNWSICFPTLPSQYFHLLRRQVLRPFRKPLVVMSPKVIFRHPDCLSPLSDFDSDKSFQPVLDDPHISIDKVNQVDTVVLCSGKVYFMLNELKLKEKMDNVALIRIEELCPFPIKSIIQVLKKYTNLDRQNKIVWYQEEHKNQGAYSFVEKRLESLAKIKLRYIGRDESELPASGSAVLHKKELAQIVNEFSSLKRK